MRRGIVFLLLACTGPFARAATHESWLVVTDLWGNPSYQTLELDRDGHALDRAQSAAQ